MCNPSVYIVEDGDKEIIVNIERLETPDSDNNIGIVITTNKQTMKFLIDNVQSCCEEYGVELHNYTFNELINEEIKLVRWYNSNDEYKKPDYSDYNSAVVCIETNNKKVYIVIYNYHNGYYPHWYTVNWGSYRDKDCI